MKFWRSRDESQREKAEIVWLHHTKPGLSERVIAGMLHVSQPYVSKVLKRVRLLGIESAIGPTAYGHYRELLETRRRGPALDIPQRPAPIATVEAPGTSHVEWVRTTTDELMPLYGSAPTTAPPPQQQASNCRAGDPSRHDDAILAYIGYNPNRPKGWFD